MTFQIYEFYLKGDIKDISDLMLLGEQNSKLQAIFMCVIIQKGFSGILRWSCIYSAAFP